MYTGTLAPISIGFPWTEAVEIVSDNDGQPVPAEVLRGYRLQVTVMRRDLPELRNSMLGAASFTVPQDGVILFTVADTTPLCPGLDYRALVDLIDPNSGTADGVRLIDANLPAT
ncbi:MAG TPA: hypothetical protein VGU70_22450 [Methylobacterium sp.]|jgi:hypothetical protein|nr:hypothetical protein [Methylobacterium sp.]